MGLSDPSLVVYLGIFRVSLLLCSHLSLKGRISVAYWTHCVSKVTLAAIILLQVDDRIPFLAS